jgi:hypothetical protein
MRKTIASILIVLFMSSCSSTRSYTTTRSQLREVRCVGAGQAAVTERNRKNQNIIRIINGASIVLLASLFIKYN